MACEAEKAVMDLKKAEWDAALAAHQDAIDNNEPPALIAALLVVANLREDSYNAAKAAYDDCMTGGNAGGVGG